MSRSLLAGTLMLALASPVVAAQEFFVAFDTTSKACRVMMTQPDGVAMKPLASGSFASLTEAQDAIARLPECNS